MAHIVIIKESWPEINQQEYYCYYRQHKKKGPGKGNTLLKKLQLVRKLKLKKYSNGLSKKKLATECIDIGISINTAYKWIALYRKGGLNLLLGPDARKGGNRTSQIDAAVANKIADWMSGKSQTTTRTYGALKKEIETELTKVIPYSTLCSYIQRTFKRKS